MTCVKLYLITLYSFISGTLYSAQYYYIYYIQYMYYNKNLWPYAWHAIYSRIRGCGWPVGPSSLKVADTQHFTRLLVNCRAYNEGRCQSRYVRHPPCHEDKQTPFLHQRYGTMHVAPVWLLPDYLGCLKIHINMQHNTVNRHSYTHTRTYKSEREKERDRKKRQTERQTREKSNDQTCEMHQSTWKLHIITSAGIEKVAASSPATEAATICRIGPSSNMLCS